jgi:hypothetical protein
MEEIERPMEEIEHPSTPPFSDFDQMVDDFRRSLLGSPNLFPDPNMNGPFVTDLPGKNVYPFLEQQFLGQEYSAKRSLLIDQPSVQPFDLRVDGLPFPFDLPAINIDPENFGNWQDQPEAIEAPSPPVPKIAQKTWKLRAPKPKIPKIRKPFTYTRSELRLTGTACVRKTRRLDPRQVEELLKRLPSLPEKKDAIIVEQDGTEPHASTTGEAAPVPPTWPQQEDAHVTY